MKTVMRVIWMVFVFLFGEVILITILGDAFYLCFYNHLESIPKGFVFLGVILWALSTWFLVDEIKKMWKCDLKNTKDYDKILPPSCFS